MRIRPAAITLALLAIMAGLAAAAALPSSAQAADPCWMRVQNDWLADGTIDGHYSVKCLQQAEKNVAEDLRDYSNITDAIDAAISAALRGPGNDDGSSSSSGGTSSGSGSDNSPAGKNRAVQGVPAQSYYRRAIDNLGTTKANSLPIPLLVLASLGALLLVSAGGLAASKRLKARRPTPPQ
jgi:hypothetical protein